MQETMKNFSQGSWSMGWDFNLEPLIYQRDMSSVRQLCLVKITYKCISTLSSIWFSQQTACFPTGIHYNYTQKHCTWHGFVRILIPKLDNEGVNSMADTLRMKLCNNHSMVCCLTHCKNKYTVLIMTLYICSPYCSLLCTFFVPRHSWSVSNCINISSCSWDLVGRAS